MGFDGLVQISDANIEKPSNAVLLGDCSTYTSRMIPKFFLQNKVNLIQLKMLFEYSLFLPIATRNEVHF
jgi:hypothetical protein